MQVTHRAVIQATKSFIIVALHDSHSFFLRLPDHIAVLGTYLMHPDVIIRQVQGYSMSAEEGLHFWGCKALIVQKRVEAGELCNDVILLTVSIESFPKGCNGIIILR